MASYIDNGSLGDRMVSWSKSTIGEFLAEVKGVVNEDKPTTDNAQEVDLPDNSNALAVSLQVPVMEQILSGMINDPTCWDFNNNPIAQHILNWIVADNITTDEPVVVSAENFALVPKLFVEKGFVVTSVN
jgi:hypothetical protein